MNNPVALHLERPLEIDEARTAARRLADQRRDAENTLQQLIKAAADAEAEYRRALSEAFLTVEGGTAAAREAAARAKATPKSHERDIAAGMVKVQMERLHGLEGERSMLKSLIDWSSHLRLDEREVIDGVTYGRRPAAANRKAVA
jgi:hypothetical protein